MELTPAQRWEKEFLQAEERATRIVNKLYEQLHGIPVFCLRDAQSRRGVLFSPAFTQGNVYRATAFDSLGFLSHKENPDLKPLLRHTYETYGATIRDDAFLAKLAAQPSFYETNAKLWCHNIAKPETREKILELVLDEKIRSATKQIQKACPQATTAMVGNALCHAVSQLAQQHKTAR